MPRSLCRSPPAITGAAIGAPHADPVSLDVARWSRVTDDADLARFAAFVRACRGRAGAAHPGLVHAAGRAVAAGVPQDPRGRRHAGVVPPAGPGHRDHPAAGPPARRRRGHPVQRHRGAARGGRRRPRHRGRHRPGGGRADPHRRRPGPAAPDHRRPTSRYVDEAVRLLVARARRDPADRLRRGAVHPGQLPDRGRAVADLRSRPRR